MVKYNPYYNASGNKYIAQLHCHSNNSDGTLNPELLTNMYQNNGYDILAITDHDYITNTTESNMTSIIANELTPTKHIQSLFCYYKRGIITDNQELITGVQNNGGLSMINHPNWNNNNPIGTIDVLKGYKFIEIFNSLCESHSHEGYAIDVWDYVLTNFNKYIYGIASDDYHYSDNFIKENIGRIIIFSPSKSIYDIKYSLLNGSFISDVGITNVNLQLPQIIDNILLLYCPGATAIRFIGDNGELIKETSGDNSIYDFSNSIYNYVRCEVISKYINSLSSNDGCIVFPYGSSWSFVNGLLNAIDQNTDPIHIARLLKTIYGNFDIFVDISILNETIPSQSSSYGGLLLHGNVIHGATPGTTTYRNGYQIDINYGSQQLRMYSWDDNGILSSIGTVSIGVQLNKIYRLRVRNINNVLYAKTWDINFLEPSEWMLTAINTTHKHGFIHLLARNGTINFKNLNIDGIKSYYQPIILK